ncbi:MAG: hypothetical protein JKY03_03590 [Aureispira sp.]|nr:hypothetical protein [Aureispira sp.]
MKQNNTKHIALWSCPRSCSTLLTRSFEQRDDCLIFDEPFYAAYLLTNGFNNPSREVMMDLLETDYLKIIATLKKPLPATKRIGFQKHHPKNILPHFGTSWMPDNHIFLIRHPEEIILSYLKCADGAITQEDIGIEALYSFLKKIKSTKGANFLVIHVDDLLKTPTQVLQKICDTFNISFSTSMLSWEKNFKNSKLLFTGDLMPYADKWYGSVKNSTGFRPYHKKERNFSDELKPLRDACMVFYQKLLPFCENFVD